MAAVDDIAEYFDSIDELDGEMSDGDEQEIEKIHVPIRQCFIVCKLI